MTLPPPIALLRPHQWVKNAFVAAPLFFSPSHWSVAEALPVALAILAFCFLSSSVYILNDAIDRESDRAHPTKRNRPLAAGTVTLPVAFAMLAGLLIAGVALAVWIGIGFLLVALGYLALNIAYCLLLKNQPILDVMSIALGFVLRVVAGGVVIAVELSAWIIIMTGLLALFIALAKRRDDVIKALDDSHRKSLHGYSRRMLDSALSLVLGALLVAYLVYTTDRDVMARLGSEQLYMTAPFVVYALLRYLQITIVEERSGSPTILALTDRPLQAAILGWLLTFGWLIRG